MQITQDNIKYIIETHIDKIESVNNQSSKIVYLGAIGEDQNCIQFCALNGCDYVNLKYGQLGQIYKENLNSQIEQGISKIISLKEYLENN